MDITTDSNLLPINFRPDTYGVYDIWNYTEDCEDRWRYDQKEWVMAISKNILKYIIDKRYDELDDAWIELGSEVLWVDSPREYNFETDSFYFSIDVNLAKFRKYISDNTDADINDFNSFLDEKYSSKDWKISLMPSSYQEWMSLDEEDEDDLEIKTMCLVAYILRDVKSPHNEIELREDADSCLY